MTAYRMPSLGADMDAGTLVEWVKRPGEAFKRGDIVAVVETQKGAIEIEAFDDGVIDRYLVEPGTKVPVGTPLAELRDVARKTEPDHADSQPSAPPSNPHVPPPPPPVAKSAQPKDQPVAPSAAGMLEVRASPAARKLAADAGIDLTTLRGSGPDGAIVFVDVEHAVKGQQNQKAPATGPRPVSPDRSEMRKAIAAAMSRSNREIPHYYLSHDINLTNAVAWLAKVNETRSPDARVLIGAVFVKSVAIALKSAPEFNGHFLDGAFQPGAGIHIGMAVALRGGGLVAPAIHNADTLSVDQIMTKLKDLVARTRAGRMRGSEFTDPTITISSLGDRGVGALYGVIHPPQVALVGIGTPQQRPWVVNDRIVARTILSLTLAADHRVSDGHRGAIFLAKIGELLQTPEAL